MKIEKTVYETLETGTYAATVKSITLTEGQFGPQLEWQFALEGDNTMKAWCSKSYSAKSKLTRWAAALLGQAPEILDTDDMIGKPCRLSILLKAREDGSEFNKVDEILAPRQGQKAKPLPEKDADGTESIPF